MTPDDESEKIRAVLREAHHGDEGSRPPFHRFLRAAAARTPTTRRAVALAGLAALVSVVAVVALRGKGSPTDMAQRPAPSAIAVKTPLDFLLEHPALAPVEALPSLRVPHTRR